jgi:rhamnogalacturonan endolyase
MFDCGNDTTEYIVHVSDSATGLLVMSGKALSVSIEPNPFNETATLIFDQATNQTFKLRLYNVEGKLLRDLGYSTGTTFTIHRGNLAAGVYLLNVTGQQYNATLKLIVE